MSAGKAKRREAGKKKPHRGAEQPGGEDLRLAPEARLAAKFDAASIAKFSVAAPGEMGFRVRDNCAEEHQM